MWTIFNSSVVKDIINIFLFCHSFKLTWSATDRRLVGDRSPTGRRPVASSRKEVPTRSPTSRRSVGNQSPISRRPVADESATNCKTLLRFLCDLCDRFEFWSRRGRRAVAVYVWLRLYRAYCVNNKDAIHLFAHFFIPIASRDHRLYALNH